MDIISGAVPVEDANPPNPVSKVGAILSKQSLLFKLEDRGFPSFSERSVPMISLHRIEFSDQAMKAIR